MMLHNIVEVGVEGTGKLSARGRQRFGRKTMNRFGNKKVMGISEIRGGYCLDCHEDIPHEIVGAWTMHNWNSLQTWDANEKKYGNCEPEATSGERIRVFR